MSFSLYDAVVPSNIQILHAVDGLLDKAQAFCAEAERSDADLIDTRLAPDMLPLGYQVVACAGHSVGAIRGAQGGVFAPAIEPWPTSLAELRHVLKDAAAALSSLDRADVDDLVDNETWFVVGDLKVPFTGANFLLSFSQPNFYFHATTAYGILRAQGVKLGKLDFVGQQRIKR